MKRIMVVDDEDMVRDVLKKALTDRGYEVVLASNGKKALELFNSMGVDLVITDILMPEKGGLSLITDLKKINQDLKVIAISGGGRDGKMDFLATASVIPGVSTLHKPFHMESFFFTVQELLGE